MAIDPKSLLLKIPLLATLTGLSFLLCTLALATPTEQLENNVGNWVHINDESIVDAPLSIVMDHFRDVQKSDSMIPGLKIKKILKQISESERIDFDHYGLPWPFKDRYTIYRARAKNIEGREILITLNSIESYPFEDKGKVVARIKESSFLLKSLPEDETKTRVTIKLTLNPGGFLPVWLLDLNAKTWSQKFLKNLRRNIRKEIAKRNISLSNRTMKTSTSPSVTF